MVRDDAAQFPIAGRARAASAIGRLGDLRAGVGITRETTDHPDLPRFVWCGPEGDESLTPFPPGKFKMGGDPQAFGNSPEPFDCEQIKSPFLIAKFPVTVEQYRCFVDDRGYEAEGDRHWTPAGRLWRDGKADIRQWPDYARDYYRKLTFPIRGPENYAPVFQTPNHPRVGVSWYEAMAFCRWLDSERIKPHLLLAAGLKGGGDFRLAADAEWELAARWCNEKKKGKPVMRTFPWVMPKADDATIEAELSKHCNWHGTGIGHTSAVGLFPSGDAFCRASDMAGNVWEWCRTKWTDLREETEREKYKKGDDADDDDENYRVLRGGSWVRSVPRRLRAASRGDDHPGDRAEFLGFRVVCVLVGSARG
jgi:formylglycine-generating enzyme required for sulfatase activity